MYLSSISWFPVIFLSLSSLSRISFFFILFNIFSSSFFCLFSSAFLSSTSLRFFYISGKYNSDGHLVGYFLSLYFLGSKLFSKLLIPNICFSYTTPNLDLDRKHFQKTNQKRSNNRVKKLFTRFYFFF